MRKFIQILIGLLFLSSGIAKALESMQFGHLISAYGFNWASFLSPIISGLEIILGLCLILDIKSKLISLIVGILTIMFTSVYTYAFFFKGITDCGCMGTYIRIPPAISFIRNLLIIGGCFWIWKFAKNEEPAIQPWKKWVVSVAGSLSFCLAGYTFNGPLYEKSNIQTGEQVNITFLHYFSDEISEGRSLVFIFRPTCSHCWDAIENIKSIKNIPEFNNVIGITYQDADTSAFMKEMHLNFKVYKYPTDELSNVVAEIPILLVLENGKVEKIFKPGAIPCGKTLKQIMIK